MYHRMASHEKFVTSDAFRYLVWRGGLRKWSAAVTLKKFPELRSFASEVSSPPPTTKQNIQLWACPILNESFQKIRQKNRIKGVIVAEAAIGTTGTQR